MRNLFTELKTYHLDYSKNKCYLQGQSLEHFSTKKQIGVKIIFETKGDLNVPLLSSMNYLLSTRLTLTLHSFYNSLMEACIPTVQQWVCVSAQNHLENNRSLCLKPLQAMFYSGVKICVLIQKCAVQMKNQTRLRKVILNLVNAACILLKRQLKWVLNLQIRSRKRVNSNEKYSIIAQTNIVLQRGDHNDFFLARKLIEKHSVLCLLVRKIKKTLFIRKRLSWLSCSNLQRLSFRKNLFPWTTNSKRLRCPKPFLPTFVTNQSSGCVRLLALTLSLLRFKWPGQIKASEAHSPRDQVFGLMLSMQNSA